MKFYRVEHNRYYVFCKIHNENVLVATVQTPLYGNEVFLSMYFPHEDSVVKTIKKQYLTENEMIDMIRRILVKNLYKMSTDILSEIKTTEFDDEKYYNNDILMNRFEHNKFEHWRAYTEKQ